MNKFNKIIEKIDTCDEINREMAGNFERTMEITMQEAWLFKSLLQKKTVEDEEILEKRSGMPLPNGKLMYIDFQYPKEDNSKLTSEACCAINTFPFHQQPVDSDEPDLSRGGENMFQPNLSAFVALRKAFEEYNTDIGKEDEIKRHLFQEEIMGLNYRKLLRKVNKIYQLYNNLHAPMHVDDVTREFTQLFDEINRRFKSQTVKMNKMRNQIVTVSDYFEHLKEL